MNRKIKIRIKYTHHPCGIPLKHETILFLPIKKKKKKIKLFFGLFCSTFFFLLSKGNFIQELNNESPEYTGSIQLGTNIIKYINHKHPSNHRPKK